MDLQTVFNEETLETDWALSAGSLATDAGLRSAVVVSLFTDRRADDDDPLPDGTTDRRGWWGDIVAPATAPTGQPWLSGSKLWLLSREKQTAVTARRAEGYARDALAWMIQTGVASALEVTAQWQGRGQLALIVTITRPSGSAETYDLVWRGGV
jgi:phage gp46-like protein